MGDSEMTWLWRGSEGPRDIPQWAYINLVTVLKVNPDSLSQLKCVELMDFEGDTLVNLIRIYDPNAAEKIIKIQNFSSLDQYPNLILYEGYREKESGRVNMTQHGS